MPATNQSTRTFTLSRLLNNVRQLPYVFGAICGLFPGSQQVRNAEDIEAHQGILDAPCQLGKRHREEDIQQLPGENAYSLDVRLPAPPGAFATPALPWVVSDDAQAERRRTAQASPSDLQATPLQDGVPIDLLDADTLPSAAVRVPGNSALCRQLHGLQCMYPLDQKLGVVTLTPEDLDTLEDDNYVNDSIMDYYIKRIQADLDPATSQRLLFFNTFFYKKLAERNGEGSSSAGSEDPRAAYERVRKWTKNVNVFQAEYIFVPVHDSAHWSLAVICAPGQLLQGRDGASSSPSSPRPPSPPWDAGSPVTGVCQATDQPLPSSSSDAQQPWLLHLDPLSGSSHNTASIADNLSQWLAQEWTHRVEGDSSAGERADRTQSACAPSTSAVVDLTGPNAPFERIPFKVSQMPQQANYHDCGLFVLTYMEFFSACPPLSITCNPGSSGSAECSCRFSQGSDWWMESGGSHSQRRIKRSWRNHFLRADWFRTHNPASLRKHIKHEILTLMQQQADPWENVSQLQAAASMSSALEEERARDPSSAYVKPDPYFEFCSNAFTLPSDSDPD